MVLFMFVTLYVLNRQGMIANVVLSILLPVSLYLLFDVWLNTTLPRRVFAVLRIGPLRGEEEPGKDDGRFRGSHLRFLGGAVPVNLLYLAIGVLVGMVVGVMPGLGASAGIAILLPLTFSMDPTSAIVMLAAIYYGAMFGGTITSVLINTPGSPRPSLAPSMDTRWRSKGVQGQLLCSARWGPSWLVR